MPNSPAPVCDRTEMIFEKPVSGEFTEILFGSDRANTLWVRFSDECGLNEWVGKFGCGFRSVMRITKVAPPDNFMILAGGFAYVVNATTRRLLNQYCEAGVEDIVYDPETRHFIAGDTHLRIIENGREIWTSPRLALDGMFDFALRDRILTAQAVTGYEGESEPFTFDLDTREVGFRSRSFSGSS